jgi:cell division septation protein DedD
MLAALTVVVLAGLIIAGTFFWLGRRDVAVNGPPQLIKAPLGPYKVKPTNPGGLDITGESETAFETSAGEDKDAQLDLNKLPEAPVAKAPKVEPAAPPSPAETKAPAAKSPPKPEPVAAGGSGSVVQLGAFANQAQAEREWTALSARFPGVAALNKMIIPFSGGIRLRGGASSPANAKQVCQTLKAAGENCFVAQ